MTPISSPADLAARFDRMTPQQRAFWEAEWCKGHFGTVVQFVENTITEPVRQYAVIGRLVQEMRR